MRIIADLHIHSKYSRGCSKDLDIKNLEKYARIKGVDLLGTGDFTHPEWIKELKENLREDKTGILKTKSGFPFILQTEISLIYTQNNKGRKIHNVVLAPDFETVSKITAALLKRGRIDYDGRPIFKIPSPEFVKMLKDINQKIEIIPAHIWTPWFSMFGSNSGFDSVRECFGDQTRHIHAIETGLSSDPEMNWRLSQLDNMAIISSSDLHSYWPWRIGREATIFDIELKYDALIDALHTRKGIVETIEVNPSYGKYHIDGHRKCNISMKPDQAKKYKNICPVCKKPLTIGVLHRVEDLADRPADYRPKSFVPFRTIIPLHELLANQLNKGIATQAVWKEYYSILKAGDSEYDIILNAPYERLLEVTDKKIADAIIKNREGKIDVIPGYDGVYGMPVFDDKKTEEKEKHIEQALPEQKGLGEFI